MKIVVAGGTGLTGSRVVALARAAGHEAVALSRATGVDLMTGRGLDEALAGADAVVDTANIETARKSTAVEFFTKTSRALVAAGARAGVRHHLTLSIVGIDDIGYGYYIGKRAQEAAVRAGDVPWTILRATQFHEFTPMILERIPGPVAVIPNMFSQTVAVDEVAAELLRLVVGEPAGMAPEIAGPDVARGPDLARRYLRATGSRRRVIGLPIPRAMASGLLPKHDGPRGVITYDEWLAGR